MTPNDYKMPFSSGTDRGLTFLFFAIKMFDGWRCDITMAGMHGPWPSITFETSKLSPLLFSFALGLLQLSLAFTSVFLIGTEGSLMFFFFANRVFDAWCCDNNLACMHGASIAIAVILQISRLRSHLISFTFWFLKILLALDCKKAVDSRVRIKTKQHSLLQVIQFINLSTLRIYVLFFFHPHPLLTPHYPKWE
jgi:hypothetical protein